MAKAAPGKAEIYELIDPRDGSVRYIGKANDTQRRLKDHLRETRRSTPLYDWIAKMRSMGLAPTARVRLVCDAADWQQAEREAIAHARQSGVRLLNVADGGDQPACDYETRAENGRTAARKRSSTTRKQRFWRLKRDLGQLLQQGFVSEYTKGRMRAAALDRPDLFGEWANV